ncbi:hypothetical protein TeGR_g3389 [Tetraparma gracilis]|uniref:CHK kinase-like domain-containing protein n=1 Tax=Tetraparma gracilis TaxID=2962635 RepID=A0ABQ6N324_9STRA|nr:hypothetical protein TeGR_g3389 [Tetraparma gracilis]
MKVLLWCCDSPFKTICHGDGRIDNVFFVTKEDGSVEAGLFDWAQAIVGPCFYEMAWTVSHSHDPTFLEEHQNVLLALYWDTLMSLLSDHQKSLLHFDDFLKGYALADMVSVCKCVIAFESIMSHPEAPDFEHKRGLVVNGMVNSLKNIDKLDAVSAIEDIVNGKKSPVPRKNSGRSAKVNPSMRMKDDF